MQNKEIMLLDLFANKIVLQGKLKTLTAMHIGSGEHNFSPLDVDNTIIRNELTNEPYIPGSSIKGVLRSYLETLLFGNKDYNTCIVTDNPCWEKKKETLQTQKNNYKDNPHQLAVEIYGKLCPICRLFGSQVMAAKLQIKDAPITKKVPIEIRDGVAINRDTGIAEERKKYTFECVPAGAEFEFLMTIDNAEEELIKLIKILIQILKNGQLTLGGKKSIGLGAVKLIDEKIYKIDKEHLLTYAMEGLKEEMRWEYV